MDEKDFIKILEEMPTGKTSKLKIGENDFALEQVKKMPGNENATMEDIKQHNDECEAWEKGYEAAVENYKEWRNKQYLKLKNMD